MKRKSKTDWLRAGMEILQKESFHAVTIENLCAALSLTKGSFYHHFGHTEGYIERLMEFWLEEHTHAFIRRAEALSDPASQQRLLYEMAIRADHRSEQAIRGWSFSHPVVGKYVAQADTIRLDYLTGQQVRLGYAPKQARHRAVGAYAILIGMQQLFPDMNPQEHFEMMETSGFTI